MGSNKKLIEWSCKRALLDLVVQSKHIHESLSFKEQVKMAEWVRDMSYEQSISAIFYNCQPLSEVGVRDFESKFKKFLKYGLAAIAGGMFMGKGGPTITMVTYYFFRKATDPCYQVCLRKFGKPLERKVCKYECQVRAAQSVVNDIKSQISRCSGSKRPIACEKKLNKVLIKWSKKLEKQLVKLQKAKAALTSSKRPDMNRVKG